jgi:hypothetical protein
MVIGARFPDQTRLIQRAADNGAEEGHGPFGLLMSFETETLGLLNGNADVLFLEASFDVV